MSMRKRGMALESLGWWILAIVIFVIIIFGIIALTGSGKGAIEYIKNLLRFR